jgi:hypothetical protein
VGGRRTRGEAEGPIGAWPVGKRGANGRVRRVGIRFEGGELGRDGTGYI